MRAYEFLTESTDQRSKLQKLYDMIIHPGTEETVRAVAQAKLDELLARLPADQQQSHLPSSRITVRTNVSDQELDRQYMVGITLNNIYQNLCSLSPKPAEILFTRGGQIHMMVLPPFMNMTKNDYYRAISMAVPGLQRINSQYLPDKGYHFILSFL